MKLSELKTRVVDTLNLDLVTLSSLITCVNNCFADIQSRGYREFVETIITKDKNETDLIDSVLPLKLTIPERFRRLVYLKVETEQAWNDTARINLASAAYKGRKDQDGNERILFNTIVQNYAFYLLGQEVFLDSRNVGFPVKSVALGYHKELVRIPYGDTTTLDSEIDIRDDLADALVLYGIYFYSTRTSLDAELSKAFLDRYRYFVEDILNNLYAEDAYQTLNNVRDDYIL